MMYALRRDVVPTSDAGGLPDPGVTYTLNAGQVVLRRDKRNAHIGFAQEVQPTDP